MRTTKKDISHHLITSSLHHFITVLIVMCGMVLMATSLHAQTQKTWQWVKQLGSHGWDKTSGVVCDSKNNLYVAGSFYDTLKCAAKRLKSLGNQDVFIAKFNDAGDLKDLFTAGGTGQDQATCICSTPGDNIAIGGLITGKVSFGKLTENGAGPRVFVTTLDSNGKFSWITTMTGDATLYMIASDKEGNIYVSGTFSGDLEGGGQKVTSRGKKDIFMARINTAGTIEKLVAYGSEEDDIPGAISISNAGAITLAGTFGKSFQLGEVKLASLRTKAKTNTFVAQFNHDFTSQWATILTGEEYCQVASIKHDPWGNLYMAGSFNLNLWTTDTVLTSKGNTDAFLLKYSPEGKLLWSHSFGTWYYDYANHVNIDNLGGVFITGSMGDTLTIDSLVVIPKAKANATLVIQFSTQGKAIWADCISGQGRSFSDGSVLDKKGNLYLTGSFRNTFEKEMDGLTSFGDQDVFLAKYYNCPTGKAEVFGERAFCPGFGTELSVNRGFTNVVWNDTITGTNHIQANTVNQYYVSMLDKQGCLLTDTMNIVQAPLPVFTLGQDTTVLVSDSVLLKAPVKYNQYRWHDYSTDLTFLAKSATKIPATEKYWLTVTDSLFCTYTDTIAITYMKNLQWADLDHSQLVTYPNPVNDVVYWYLKTDAPCQLVVELTDENGRVLYHQYLERYFPEQVMQVPMRNMPVGPFYLRLNDSAAGQHFKTVRIVKQ